MKTVYVVQELKTDGWNDSFRYEEGMLCTDPLNAAESSAIDIEAQARGYKVRVIWRTEETVWQGKCLGIGQSMDLVLTLIRNSNGGRTEP